MEIYCIGLLEVEYSAALSGDLSFFPLKTLTGPIRKPEPHLDSISRAWGIFFTHIPEISIQDLHISMDNLQSYQLIIRRSYTTDKKQRGISSVYNLRIYVPCSLASHLDQFWIQFSHIHTLVFKEITHSCSSSQDKLRDILYNLGFGFRGHRRKPFRETDFT